VRVLASAVHCKRACPMRPLPPVTGAAPLLYLNSEALRSAWWLAGRSSPRRSGRRRTPTTPTTRAPPAAGTAELLSPACCLPLDDRRVLVRSLLLNYSFYDTARRDTRF